MGIAGDLVCIVLAALVGAAVARALRQPLIIGYILAGVAIGPHTGGYTVTEIHDIEKLAEIGVALLLFALGLEFSFAELRRFWRIALLGTPLQILLVGTSGYLVATYLGQSWSSALWFGAIISLSSTVVVLKTLSENDLLNSTAARVMLGILIAQDVALVPMLIVLPQLTGSEFAISAVVASVVKSIAVLLGIYVIGTKALPRLFGFVASFNTRELLFLLTLAFALGLGYLTFTLGLSFALGAFVAGVLLSETDFSGQALSDISSLRDLFGLLFFVSVGMLFDPSFFVENAFQVVVIVLLLLLSKAIVTFAVAKVFGYGLRTSWRVGIGLAQIGEFAFVIASVGLRSHHISAEVFALIISATVLSMMTTPFLFWIAPRLESRIGRIKTERPDGLEQVEQLSDHVVVIGAGMVGEYVARVLEQLRVPCVLVESDYRTASRLRGEHHRVIFGDGTHRVLLEAAGVSKAKLVIVATPGPSGLVVLLQELRALHPTVPTVVRVENRGDLVLLKRFDVREAVQPKREAALEMVRQALLALEVPESSVMSVLSDLRARQYDIQSDPGQQLAGILDVSRLLELRWINVRESMGFHGRSLRDLHFRDSFGVSVVAIARKDEVIPNPAADLVIDVGDTIGVIGTGIQLVGLLSLAGESPNAT